MVESTRLQPVESDTYTDVLEALFGARRKGIDLSLDRIQKCLRVMGLEDGGAPRSVQIAGTNGKGSTARCLASILAASGLRVGVFSSPHLLSLCERFSIDQEPVSRQELVRAYEAIADHREALTFFEQVTLMAAWLFRNQWVDVAIYEVGLGGRLDSTSAVMSQVGVVTGIGRDHCEYLGTEESEIAAEKAAIFRSGGHAVVGLSASDEIRAQLCEVAVSKGAQTWIVDETHAVRVPEELKLMGSHQRENAASAVAASMALRASGLDIPDAAITEGLQQVEMPGRLQEVEAGLWVDGAHNAQASKALAEAVAARGPWVMVVGLSEGKEIREFLTPLQSHCEHLIVTEAANDRACGAARIAKEATEFPAVDVEYSAAKALQKARSVAGSRPILITGSLLLLGEVLQHLGHGPADPILVVDPGGRKFAPDSPDAYP
jgi:dihydrofolate synthase/folylpolyglutamate synthase